MLTAEAEGEVVPPPEEADWEALDEAEAAPEAEEAHDVEEPVVMLKR